MERKKGEIIRAFYKTPNYKKTMKNQLSNIKKIAQAFVIILTILISAAPNITVNAENLNESTISNTAGYIFENKFYTVTNVFENTSILAFKSSIDKTYTINIYDNDTLLTSGVIQIGMRIELSKNNVKTNYIIAGLPQTLARVSSPLLRSRYAEGAVLVSGSSWMKGQGEDVRGNGGNYNTRWQCIELPQIRLYPKMGWPRVYAAGNEGAMYIPEGSPGLTRYNPGSKYIPVPGDLIIEKNGSYGHVAVVDYTDTSTGIIYAVEQNGPDYKVGRTTYQYNGSNYKGGTAGNEIKCILHAPDNKFTNTNDKNWQNYDAGVQPPKVGEDLPYRAYQQTAGYLPVERYGLTAGITGSALRMEAFRIDPSAIPGLAITAKVWIQDKGFTTFNVTKDTDIGTKDQARRLESVQLTSNKAQGRILQYSVHIQSTGWTGWANDGETLGVGGSGKRIEAIRIRYLKSNFDTGAQPSPIGGQLNYRAYIQNAGWLPVTSKGSTAGVTGAALRLEAIKIDPTAIAGLKIDAKVWMSGVSAVDYKNITKDTVIGSSGQSRMMESISFTSNKIGGKKMQYSVHIQGVGWTVWTDEGKAVGTPGSGKRIEAIRIRYV